MPGIDEETAVSLGRAVEHDRADLEHPFPSRLAQIALAEPLGDHAGLHDREVEQIALQDDEAGAFAQRLVKRIGTALAFSGGQQVEIFLHPDILTAIDSSGKIQISISINLGTV